MKIKTIKSILLGLLALASLASAVFLNTTTPANKKGATEGSFFLPKTEAESDEEKAPNLPNLTFLQRAFDLAKRLAERAN